MLLRWTRVVSWRLEARVGGEGVYGDGRALMRGVEVVVVADRVVGDDDVGRRYVVVECGIGELFGDACRRVPRFGRGVVGHEDVARGRLGVPSPVVIVANIVTTRPNVT